MRKDILSNLKMLRQNNPLILNITNLVTMEFVANGLLCLGASPIMSMAIQDTEELVQHTNSIVINLGTLDECFVKLCKQACQLANQYHIPIILDPVGAGASKYRTETALFLIKHFNIAIIRGNASEIMALHHFFPIATGVDSKVATSLAIESAFALSQTYHTTIAVSGKTDIIVDNHLSIQHEGGSALMPTITGSGCLLTAVIAAFHAIEKNSFAAAERASLFYAKCGESAQQKSNSPGSFRTDFLNALYLHAREEQE